MGASGWMPWGQASLRGLSLRPHPQSHSVTCPRGDSPETLLSFPAGQTRSLGSSGWIKQGAERISPCWRALGAALSTFCRALKIAALRGGQGETGEADSSRTESRLLRLAFHGDVFPWSPAAVRPGDQHWRPVRLAEAGRGERLQAGADVGSLVGSHLWGSLRQPGRAAWCPNLTAWDPQTHIHPQHGLSTARCLGSSYPASCHSSRTSISWNLGPERASPFPRDSQLFHKDLNLCFFPNYFY